MMNEGYNHKYRGDIPFVCTEKIEEKLLVAWNDFSFVVNYPQSSTAAVIVLASV
jgi:hypothetical protein